MSRQGRKICQFRHLLIFLCVVGHDSLGVNQQVYVTSNQRSNMTRSDRYFESGISWKSHLFNRLHSCLRSNCGQDNTNQSTGVSNEVQVWPLYYTTARWCVPHMVQQTYELIVYLQVLFTSGENCRSSFGWRAI